MPAPTDLERRILIVDDNVRIHEDFRKVLASQLPSNLDVLEAELFDAPLAAPSTGFTLASAFQGREALDQVIAAKAAGTPFALAFVDMRMPPGWDGLETIQRIWAVDPAIQIVICSAYSDYPWSELHAKLGEQDSLLIIKKPFDPIEILQCAHALTEKWRLARTAAAHVASLENELRLAQRLETIGELASGIAHEIATPVQYIGDSVELLREDLASIIALHGELRLAAASARKDPAAIDRLLALVESLRATDTSPELVDTIGTGVVRITSIVRAMREFAHPGSRTPQPTDLNHTIRTALAVSASRYRSVAELATELRDLPPVTCYESDLAQVIVNLIVNAAHAIQDRGAGPGQLGVESRVDGDDVVISVSDSGCGIPVDVQGHIFDPFFTTKSVGRGTGQGLSISRAIVVDRHGGQLTFETVADRGTKFFVRIPIAGPPAQQR